MAENQSLGFFLNKLEKERPEEVLDIHDPMPRDFVFMAMAKELDKEEFPPIIRAKIEGYDMPVLGNVFASRKRIANMLGFEDESKIAENWAHIEKNLIAPKIVKDGPIHDVVLTEDKIDCGALPLMQYYPTDAGRYISSGIVVVKDPETGVHNLSIHRMQYKGPNRFGMLTFYNHPQTIDDMVTHIVGKILDRFGVEDSAFCRWGETRPHEGETDA